jgi:hypothetical protein
MKLLSLLSPLLILVGGAMSCERDQVLPPEAGPAPAPLVKVPVLVKLPLSMTQPCLEPQGRPLEIDADLLADRDAWMVTAKCANQKLKDADKAQQQAIEGAQP